MLKIEIDHRMERIQIEGSGSKLDILTELVLVCNRVLNDISNDTVTFERDKFSFIKTLKKFSKYNRKD